MFDVSWTDPERETVGQRKNRKEAPKTASGNPDTRARRSSLLSTRSIEQVQQPKLGLLNFFGGSSEPQKKGPQRTRSASKPAWKQEEVTEASRWVHSYFNAPPLNVATHELAGGTPTAIHLNSNLLSLRPYQSDVELSSTSDSEPFSTTFFRQTNLDLASESVFSGWTGDSGKTQSSWSSAAESVKSPGRIFQPLSTTSFISQNTEITVAPRESVKDAEMATIVHITAAGPPVPGFLDPPTV